MCKHSNVLSRPVLMGRGLDGYLLLLVFGSLGSFQGPVRDRSPSERPELDSVVAGGKVSGGFSEGETPLPIPNREVKPLSADGTWLARAWESRSPPVLLRGRPQGRPLLIECGQDDPVELGPL